jgi:hypothetical protein
MTRTVWWEDGQLRMIDQRVLPLAFEIVSYTRYEDVAVAIRDMVVRGAPAIGATGAFGMALAAQQSQAAEGAALLADLDRAKHVLDAARPTAVNLRPAAHPRAPPPPHGSPLHATWRVATRGRRLPETRSLRTCGGLCWRRRSISPTKMSKSTCEWAPMAPKSSRQWQTS